MLHTDEDVAHALLDEANVAVVHALAHDMIVIKDGKVVEQGDAQTLFGNPQHPYTRELLQASSVTP